MAKVIFFGLKNWSIHRYWENTIAKHLELNEHDVINISYSKMFGGDDLSSGRPYEHVHKHIASKTGESINKMYQFRDVRKIEDYFGQEELQETEYILGRAGVKELKTIEYKGVPIGKLCRISTVRQSHTVNEEDPNYIYFFKENVSTAKYMVDAFERLLEQERPDAVFVMNGIMFMEAILIYMCKLRGIRVISYERAARPQHLYVTANEPVNDFMFDNRFDIDKPLTKKELKEIEDYLNDRRTSKNTTQKFQDNDTDDLEKTKELINYEKIKDKTIVSLFTNVMWDTAAVDRDTIFDNVLDWCVSTIDWAKENPQVELFIRIHPADSRYWNVPGAAQLYDEITKVINWDSGDYGNVHLIKSTEKINSYCLAELSNICSTYTSQIGGEIAAMGKPLIVAGDAFYGKQGIGHMPKNKTEYFLMLNSDVTTNQDEALRFEHFLYFKMHFPMGLIKEDASKGMGVVTQLGFLQDNGNGQLVADLSIIKSDKDCEKIAEYILQGIKDEYDVEEFEVSAE